ncbi:MAG: hypothetical protein M1837_005085 [Sclerophora amabilis]|nr:MAG: hypothetical protein M1837_005085 [Sclerophora amabilis]
MAFFQEDNLAWNTGEEKMHQLLRVPRQDNPTVPLLTPGAGYMLTIAPLLALGTLDKQGRPWTTVWGGQPGFSRPVGHSMIGIKTLVDRRHDPIIEALLGDGGEDDEVVRADGSGKMVGALAIDLETRKRVKIYGRLMAGAMGQPDDQVGKNETREVQLVVKVEQSLGNCPKYLNSKQINPARPKPKLISDKLPLPQKALELLGKSDLFFISSSNHELDMDTNHRGGPPGFTRVLSNNSEDGTVLVYPEYSGNRLYQTLGNLQITPMAGLVFPDFDSGDVLYLTCNTEILLGRTAAQILPRSNIAVKMAVTGVRFVEDGLSFRGELGERSPYNPPVRYLRNEKDSADGFNAGDECLKAKLVKRESITPSISRFRFSLSDSKKDLTRWKAGQYVALSFEHELNMGYSHMRDDDPKSLNDDYIRTFTVSSCPAPQPPSPPLRGDKIDKCLQLKPKEFEITIRRVGAATNLLFRWRPQIELKLPLRGFGGEFFIGQPHPHGQDVGHEDESATLIPVIAGGIGITPLLAQLPSLNVGQLRLFWTVRAEDINLVIDVLERHPALASSSTRVFVTAVKGVDDEIGKKQCELISRARHMVSMLAERRMEKEDLLGSEEPTTNRWYVCTGTGLRKTILHWLEGEGREVVYEDFNY